MNSETAFLTSVFKRQVHETTTLAFSQIRADLRCLSCRIPCLKSDPRSAARCSCRPRPRRRPPDFAPSSETPGSYFGQAVLDLWFWWGEAPKRGRLLV